MGKGVVIDCNVLKDLANPNGTSDGIECRAWAENLRRKGTEVRISGIANYESRRKLIQIGSMDGIAKLDEVVGIYGVLPVTDVVLRIAARNWADLKIGMGRNGTNDLRLDADVIIGAEARMFAEENGIEVTIATDNVQHFVPLVDMKYVVRATQWRNILP